MDNIVTGVAAHGRLSTDVISMVTNMEGYPMTRNG
jgi:hypothetical protein